LNLYVFDIIEKVLFYYVILSAIQNHSSNRIQNSKTSSSSKIVLRFSKKENRKILHSSCLVRCNHFESLSRSRSLKTSFIRLYARIVVASCLTLCSSRTIRSRKTRFLLIFWKIWSFESQMIQIACWRWFNKSETKSEK
jgi:hypothetical protein